MDIIDFYEKYKQTSRLGDGNYFRGIHRQIAWSPRPDWSCIADVLPLAEAWGLKEQEQMRLLGLVSRSTFQSWKRGAVAAVPKDTMERISYILGIYKGLQILLPNTADQWILNLNKAGIFGGRSAIERMASGNVADLNVVRQYIDAQLSNQRK